VTDTWATGKCNAAGTRHTLLCVKDNETCFRIIHRPDTFLATRYKNTISVVCA